MIAQLGLLPFWTSYIPCPWQFGKRRIADYCQSGHTILDLGMASHSQSLEADEFSENLVNSRVWHTPQLCIMDLWIDVKNWI